MCARARLPTRGAEDIRLHIFSVFKRRCIGQQSPGYLPRKEALRDGLALWGACTAMTSERELDDPSIQALLAESSERFERRIQRAKQKEYSNRSPEDWT